MSISLESNWMDIRDEATLLPEHIQALNKAIEIYPVINRMEFAAGTDEEFIYVAFYGKDKNGKPAILELDWHGNFSIPENIPWAIQVMLEDAFYELFV